MPTIQFSLPEKDSLKLQSLAIDGEKSVSLTAKRLIAGILDGIELDIPADHGKALSEKITALDCRLTEMETVIGELNEKISQTQEVAIVTQKPQRARKQQKGGVNAKA